MIGFTYFNVLQLALAAAALVLVARRLYALSWLAPLDTPAFLAALEPALQAPQLELAQTLSRACTPAWAARLALAGLAELGQARDPRPALDETLADLERDLAQGRDAIVTLGRMASPLAFIGIIIETGRALGGGEGLAGLQRGLPETIGLQRSLFAFALGVATTLVCFSAAGIAQRQAQALRRDLERVAQTIARAAISWRNVGTP